MKKICMGMRITEISEIHHQWVADIGWLNNTPLECLALIESGVSEAVNECRGDKPTSRFGGELADIMLRIMDLANQEGIDMDYEIVSRMISNASNLRLIKKNRAQ